MLDETKVLRAIDQKIRKKENEIDDLLKEFNKLWNIYEKRCINPPNKRKVSNNDKNK